MSAWFTTFAQTSLDYGGGYTPDAQTYTANSGTVPAGLIIGIVLVALVVAVFSIVCMWRIFVKAGQPGWKSIIPVYNSWVMLELGGQPGWWAIVALVPFVGLVAVVFYILALVELCKRFGRGPGFAVLLIFLPIIALPILAFGKDTYHNPQPPMPAAGGSAVPPAASAAPQPQAPAAPQQPRPPRLVQ